MNAPHVTSLLVAPLKGASAAAALLPGAAADEPVDFSKLVADALGPKQAELAARDDNPRDRKPATKPEADEKPEDAIALLGLPAAAPLAEPAKAAPEEKPADASPVTARAAPGVPAAKKFGNAPEAKPEHAGEHLRERTPPAPLAPAAEPAREAVKAESGKAAGGDEIRMLVQAGEVQHAQPAAHARPSLPVAAPVGTPQWREEFSAAVRVIATEKIQSAEIRLHPPELGPVQVSLRLEAKEASIAFSAPHADTRQALEAALPRLRELLEAGGISLGSTSVDASGSGAFARDPARDQAQAQPWRGPGAQPQAAPAAPAARPARSPRLVDTFA